MKKKRRAATALLMLGGCMLDADATDEPAAAKPHHGSCRQFFISGSSAITVSCVGARLNGSQICVVSSISRQTVFGHLLSAMRPCWSLRRSEPFSESGHKRRDDAPAAMGGRCHYLRKGSRAKTWFPLPGALTSPGVYPSEAANQAVTSLAFRSGGKTG